CTRGRHPGRLRSSGRDLLLHPLSDRRGFSHGPRHVPVRAGPGTGGGGCCGAPQVDRPAGGAVGNKRPRRQLHPRFPGAVRVDGETVRRRAGPACADAGFQCRGARAPSPRRHRLLGRGDSRDRLHLRLSDEPEPRPFRVARVSILSDLSDHIALGLQVAVSPANLGYCLLGVLLGQLLGALPGIGALVAITLLFPVTYHLEPTSALIMLAGIYYGCAYGGSAASILLNLPGTPSAAVACLDGYPLARQGRAGVALSMTTIGSFVGGSVGILLMMMFAPVIAEAALQFGPWEYVSLIVMGLLSASAIGSNSPLNGI